MRWHVGTSSLLLALVLVVGHVWGLDLLQVNATSPNRVVTTGDWISTPNGVQTTSSGSILVFYRGRNVTLLQDNASVKAFLDGNSTRLYSLGDNKMGIGSESTTYDDHQLRLDVTAPSSETPATISALLIENDDQSTQPYVSGNVADDSSPLIVYSDHGWTHSINDSFSSMNTVSSTSTVGAWVYVVFSGSGLSVYGIPTQEQATVQLDISSVLGGTVTKNFARSVIHAKNTDTKLYRVPLFNDTFSAWANAHSYNISLEEGTLNLDFIRVEGTILQTGDQSTSESGWTSSISPEGSAEAIVFALCTILLILFCIGYFLFLFRRRQIWNAARRRRNKATGSPENGPDAKFVGQQVRIRASPLVISFPQQAVDSVERELSPSSSTTSKRPTLFTPYQHPREQGSFSQLSSSHMTTTSPDNASSNHDRDVEQSAVASDTGAHDHDPDVLQLSHNDLARVFDRARALQLAQDAGQSIPPEDENQDYFENLARRLAAGANTVSSLYLLS